MHAWITTSSPHPEAMINPLNAACQNGYVPDTIHLLETPGTADTIDQILDVIATIVEQYSGEEPAIELSILENEVLFNQIHDYVRTTIEEVKEVEGEVAVDITPGRKFMSAICFAAGVQYGADHVFYNYVTSTGYFGQSFPEIPRTATRLYDFTEEL